MVQLKAFVAKGEIRSFYEFNRLAFHFTLGFL